MAISFDLAEHDKNHHHGHFDPATMTCKFRDNIKKYESVDDLSKARDITDALEDSELLERMIGEAIDDDEKEFLKGRLDATDAILAGFLGGAGKKTPVKFGPNAPIAHDEKAFPDKNDAKWQEALAHYGDSSYGWKSAGSGSTKPHYLDINGKRYFVKKAGMKPSYTKEAARNEANANNFLRLAGLNAPDSMYMKSNDGGRFCISAEADLSGGTLVSNMGDKNVSDQIRDAYPIMSLLYNMDIMQNADNAFVDKNGNAVFLDNGSTFGFSAQGARNKYFDFDMREDPITGNPDYLALANFKGNNSGSNWRAAINGGKQVDMETALKLASKFDMGALAREAKKQGLLKQMPKNGQDAFIKYADELDKLSAKYKPKQSATTNQSASASGDGSRSNGNTTSAQQQGSGGVGSSSQSIGSSGGTSSNTKSSSSTANATPSPAPSPAPTQRTHTSATVASPVSKPTPVPAPTMTPAQHNQVRQVQAMPPQQRAKAIARLKRMMNSANPSQKAVFQAMVNMMSGLPANYQAPAQPIPPAGQQTPPAPQIPANVPNTPAAKRLVNMINNPKTSPSAKATYVAMLNKMVASANSGV